MEPEPKQFWMAAARAELDGGAEAWNLGSGFTDIVCGARELYK